jgi:hypothetical protein
MMDHPKSGLPDFGRFKCASRVNPTCVVKPAGDACGCGVLNQADRNVLKAIVKQSLGGRARSKGQHCCLRARPPFALAKEAALPLEPAGKDERDPSSATLRDEGECNADALRYPRDHPEGSGPFRRRPHSRRAPAAYRPLRAGRAFAPGHSGETASTEPSERPKRGRKREKD